MKVNYQSRFRISVGNTWYLKYCSVFFIGMLFFLWPLVTNPQQALLENVFWTFVFFGLIISFILWGKRFRIEVLDNQLKVTESVFKDRVTFIPGEKIKAIYVRQSVIDKLLGVKNLFIHYDNPKGDEDMTLRVFGASIKIAKYLVYPGIHGNYLSIPDVPESKIADIQAKLSQTAGKYINIINLGVGLPYYTKFSKVLYFIRLGLILWILIMGTIALVIYLLL